MRIPARFAPILFGALLSAIMVALVSGFVIAITQGIHQGFAASLVVWQPDVRVLPRRAERGSEPLFHMLVHRSAAQQVEMTGPVGDPLPR